MQTGTLIGLLKRKRSGKDIILIVRSGPVLNHEINYFICVVVLVDCTECTLYRVFICDKNINQSLINESIILLFWLYVNKLFNVKFAL